MLDTAFYLVLNMSIIASIMGLLLVLLRFVKVIPRQGIYLLWSVVLLRLVFPFALPSEASFLNFTGGIVKKVVEVSGSNTGGVGGDMHLSLTNSIGAAESYFPVTYKNDLLDAIFGAGAVIWFAGAVATVAAVLVLYGIAGKELMKARHVEKNIYRSRAVGSPVVAGVLRQRIILPENFENNAPLLRYVLLHENVHIRRHDNLLRMLGVLTACVHWFNPLVWIFLGLFLKDMELTCDLKAIKALSKEERKRYAQALVELGGGKDIFMAAAFGKTNLKTRVIHVLNYRRLTAFAAIASLIFIAAMAVAFLTNPVR